MFDIQNYASFVITILLFQLVPGPGTISILHATARLGYRGGLGAIAGTLTGDLLYMIAAAFGLATVMHAFPNLFLALQWLGVAYLCWLGFRFLICPMNDDREPGQPLAGALLYFRRAFIVCLTNPKAILFFVAFFPLFLHSDTSVWTLAIMIIHVSLISFLYQLLLVLAGHAISCRLAALPSARRFITRVAGMLLVGFGIKLALDNR